MPLPLPSAVEPKLLQDVEAGTANLPPKAQDAVIVMHQRERRRKRRM